MTFEVLRRLDDGGVVILYEDGTKVRYYPKTVIDSPEFSAEIIGLLTPVEIYSKPDTTNPYVRRIPVYDWRDNVLESGLDRDK